ncbi:tripartite tricarboxylate transporter TctB family protein [Falsirhodobacter algicola]|uniref:DUF1468 domain-containing protein n=1 Tax=Falsirhodobacter algicola TaxID=2692330 RepID=A0A8J8MV14_9RHOB|nr:tripartite tricarboxylate transporter TctB family protein [Falsirhodobacter algicola]QUS37231.1 hypothetical protein GR316_12710 [Falsirhodobacter algicola]
MKITDALLGGFFLCLGAVMFWQAAHFPSFGGQPYGAALLPSILAVGFMIAGVMLVLRDLRARRTAGGPLLALQADLKDGGAPALLAVIGNVAAHIWLTPRIGYLPVSIVALSVLFLTLRLRPWVAVVLAIGTTLACWWLFAGLLRVPLPRGFLDGVL